ncbi:J domain-containing protein [Streptomyces sp. NPDC054888]
MAGLGPSGRRHDHYAVLGVEPTASAGQITSAYRRLVRALHPDAHPGRPAADSRFADVVAAYGILRDPVLRAAYDSRLGRSRDTGARAGRSDGTDARTVNVTHHPPPPPRPGGPPLYAGPTRWSAG